MPSRDLLPTAAETSPSSLNCLHTLQGDDVDGQCPPDYVGLASGRTRRSLFQEQSQRTSREGGPDVAVLMVASVAVAIVLALSVSPYAWEGKVREFHPHLYTAVFMGGGSRCSRSC